MERINDLGAFEVDGGAGDNDELYQAMPRHTPHHRHHVPDGGAPPINKGSNARPTVNPNERANALGDVSTVRERVVSPPSAEALDGTGATGGKGRRGKKKCSCCNTSPCLCRSGECKSCGKTGGDCGCMGGKTGVKMVGGVMGGRARSKSKTRAKSKGKRAKSKGKK